MEAARPPGSPRPQEPGRKLGTPAPALGGERREGKGALRCGAGGAGGGPSPGVCGRCALPAEPRSWVRHSRSRGDRLLVGAGEESREWPDKHGGGEGRLSLSPPPSTSSLPPAAEGALGAASVCPGARGVSAPFRGAGRCGAVRGAQSGRGRRRLLLKVKISLSNYFSQEREGGSGRGKPCCVWQAHQSEML